MFVTKRYIYPGKKRNEIEIRGVKLNPFLVDFIDNSKQYYKDAYFFDEDFSFLGDFFYFDETIANINGKIIEHNLLMPLTRKEIFDDLQPIKDFFEKHLEKRMVVISFEDLSLLGIESISPFEAFKVKEKLDKVLINNKNIWVDLESLKNKFVYAGEFSLKIDKIKKFKTKRGMYKFNYTKRGRFLKLSIYNEEIDLLDLIKVENEIK